MSGKTTLKFGIRVPLTKGLSGSTSIYLSGN